MKIPLPISARREGCRLPSDVPEPRTRRRTRSTPNEALQPALAPSIEALWAERPFAAVLLRALRVPARDRDDLLQTVLLGAWEAIRACRYRPDPRRHPRHALRAWLYGIVWRQASHYRESAYVRRAILRGAPFALSGEANVEIDGELLARAALRELAALPAGHRDVLLAAAGPLSLAAWARARGMNPHSAASRLRCARKALAGRLASPGLPSGRGCRPARAPFGDAAARVGPPLGAPSAGRAEPVYDFATSRASSPDYLSMKEHRTRPAPPPASDPAPAPAPARKLTAAPDPEPAAASAPDPAPAIGSPPRPSFEEVYQGFLPYVLVVLWRLGVASRDLHDVAHEVFLVVHLRLKDYDPRRALKPWIAAISVHVALRHRQLARNQRELLARDEGEPIELVDPGLDAERRVAQAETQRIVRELIQRIELERRAVFVLYDLEGCDMRDIAQALQISVNTAWDRLRRARSELTAAVKRLAARDPDALGLHRLRFALAPFALADRPMLLDAGEVQVERAQELAGPLWARLQRSLASTGGLARGTDGPAGRPAARPDARAIQPHSRRSSDAAKAAGAAGEERTPPVVTIARSRLVKAGAAMFLGGAGVGAIVVYAALRPPAAAPVVFVRAEAEHAAPVRADRAAARLAVAADAVVDAGVPAAADVAATAPPRAPSRSAAPLGEPDTTEESALIRSARRALSDGRATEALDMLAEHARNHPRSPSAPQREMLAIQALVQAGRRADAAARAAQLRAAFPHAMLLPAVEAAVNGP